MKWHHPPITKIYEALGTVADDRVEVPADNLNQAKVYSSSRNKFYSIAYDPDMQAIMSNDNSSFWKGYLGYPSIAFLMKKGALSYDAVLGNLLKGVAWKDMNQKYKNDFEAALAEILSTKTEEERKKLAEYAEKVDAEIKALNLSYLGKKTLPPDGY